MPIIPEHKIEQIKSLNNIVEVIGSYISLKKKGQNYWARCPFHDEKTASFSVSQSKQIYHCFGCGVGGNVINFVMDYEKLSFVEAVKELAERVNVELDEFKVSEKDTSDTTRLYQLNELATNFYHDLLLSSEGKSAFEYLSKRELSKDVIEKFKIGYAPDQWNSLKNKIATKKYSTDIIKTSGLSSESKGKTYDRFRDRIMFPIYNLKGKPIAFGGRTLKNDKNIGKYINTPETPIYHKSFVLYGLNITKDYIHKSKTILVVEGYMDFLKLYQFGFKNCVACSGTAFTQQHGKTILRYAETAILIYDGDDAGQKATLRAGFVLTAQKINCKILTLDKDDDPDTFLQKNGAKEFQKKID
ncbi:MAG: DNA primase, partial [Candidatus Marinimicrobia bacterium]|nr:DNA primase [Candidatus Neomarinimicrobiota bacterium]